MGKFDASMDRDANRMVMPGPYGTAFLTKKVRTFTGAANLGAQGTTTLFTVTGDVLVSVCVTAQVQCTGAGSYNLGVSGATTRIIDGTNDITGLTTTKSLQRGNGLAQIEILGSPVIVPGGQDIIETIGTNDVTAGQLTVYCFWRPMSTDGFVVAA